MIITVLALFNVSDIIAIILLPRGLFNHTKFVECIGSNNNHNICIHHSTVLMVTHSASRGSRSRVVVQLVCHQVAAQYKVMETNMEQNRLGVSIPRDTRYDGRYSILVYVTYQCVVAGTYVNTGSVRKHTCKTYNAPTCDRLSSYSHTMLIRHSRIHTNLSSLLLNYLSNVQIGQ